MSAGNIDFETVLRKCSTERAYLEACKGATHGTVFDLHLLEPLFQELRTKEGRCLQLDDLDRIFEEGKTIYAHYWRWPKEKTRMDAQVSLNETQRGTSGWKESVVRNLFACLSRMEVASVVLSCVYPEDFAVYSPPIMTILQVPPCPPIQHYLNYCEELREWGRHFLDSENVRTADRAIWVFYQRAYAYGTDERIKKIHLTYRKAYQEDFWIRQRHARMTLSSYFSEYPPLEQARFLVEVDLDLAATIVGCEFEARLKDLVPEARRRRLPYEGLGSVIEYVAANCGYAHKKSGFDEIRGLRNKAIHRLPGLTPEKVKMMIAETRLIPVKRASGPVKF